MHGQNRWVRENALYQGGLSPSEVTRLTQIKRRYDRGDYRPQELQRRLLFARWLVQHGLLSEAIPEQETRHVTFT